MSVRSTRHGRDRRRSPTDHAASGGTERAVSDLIGFVLVFSLVVAVVGIVSVAGLGSLEAARDAEQVDNAERALEVLADNVADVSRRGAPSRATEISLEGASLSLGEETLVVVRDPDTGAGDPSFLTSRVFQVRPIVYEAGDTQLVYVMGAVFRDDREGGTVVESWSPVLDADRTFIPVVTTVSATDGSQHVQSSTVLVRAVANQRRVPVADVDPSQPNYDQVEINVRSARQDLWARMLGNEPALSCSTNGPRWTNCSLSPAPDQLYVTETRIAIEFER